MNESFVVTIGGPHGSGRTTVAKAVSEYFGMHKFSTGEIFRQIAKNRGVSVMELDMTAEKEVDLEVDRRSREAGLKGGIVFESDLAAWVNAKLAGKKVVRIWLDASAEKRGERIFNDEKSRTSEEYATLKEAVSAVKMRDSADQTRYLKRYNVQIDPKVPAKDSAIQIEYDKIIETDSLDLQGVKNIVIAYLIGKGLKPAQKTI